MYLKVYIMHAFRVIMLAYFLFRIGVRDVVDFSTTINETDVAPLDKDTRMQRSLLTDMSAYEEIFDLVFVIVLLFNYRPRKWPNMFTIAMFRQDEQVGSDEEIVRARLERIHLPLLSRQGYGEIELKDLNVEDLRRL